MRAFDFNTSPDTSMIRTLLKSQNATHIKSNDQGKDEEF